MSHQFHDSKKNPDIKCPECNTRLNGELISYLLDGQTVYCEMCGFAFTGISQDGDVKPLEKSPEQDENTPNLNKKEIQWIEWKKEWNNIKNSFQTEWKQYKARKQKKKESGNSSHTFDVSKPEIPLTTSSSTFPEHSQNRVPNKNGITTAIELLTQLAPVYYAIIFAMAIFNLVDRGVTPLYFSGAVVILAIVVSYDLKIASPSIRAQNVPHAGISLIIMGVFSLHAFGAGIFLLTRGILYLVNFIQELKIKSPNHIAVKGSGDLSGVLWFREVILSFISVFQNLIFMFFFSGILFSINEFVKGSRSGASVFNLVWILVFSSISLSILKSKINPLLVKTPVEDIPNKEIITMLILGVFTSTNGCIGVPVLIFAILMLVYQKKEQELIHPLPSTLEISQIRPKIVATKKNDYSYGERGQNGHLKARFDPATGRPLFDTSYQNLENKNAQSSKNPIENNVVLPVLPLRETKLSDKSIFLPGDIAKEIYSVLDPTVREKFVKLSVTDEERDLISKALIYLEKEHQLRYMDELQNINQDPEVVFEQYIKRIHVLPIEPQQRRFLVEQLEYLPFEKQEEFVSFLEQTVK
ncbi:hypothetical protein NEF87_001429 [Candidatus Lokiarchaeum ossiferum]|uniref:TFIIB-type zinc ribbon-containing protein n=1 Tax=Candidatus Lokiarchaeum ossiferum TaxID=2951803 RepID=A0ABY6HNQ2_9ARCH|nr:hypothetical protein NEF87_001429 [Candidatus Lokiarchaeum sp. B-35]